MGCESIERNDGHDPRPTAAAAGAIRPSADALVNPAAAVLAVRQHGSRPADRRGGLRSGGRRVLSQLAAAEHAAGSEPGVCGGAVPALRCGRRARPVALCMAVRSHRHSRGDRHGHIGHPVSASAADRDAYASRNAGAVRSLSPRGVCGPDRLGALQRGGRAAPRDGRQPNAAAGAGRLHAVQHRPRLHPRRLCRHGRGRRGAGHRAGTAHFAGRLHGADHPEAHPAPRTLRARHDERLCRAAA